MRVVTELASMQRLAQSWKNTGIGFVPTMGYLHEGHISLVRRARKLVGSKGKVVVSIYVNPTQFSPHEDLAKYPRDLPRDKKLCREAGVDLLFLPRDEQMYPANPRFSTYVVEEAVSSRMEGAARPTHFRGVTTIVAKLFNLVLPDVAVFGAKDFQQATVIQRMTRDLNFPVKVVVAPTVRESDGLAMSSRNKYLTVEQRKQATLLWETIQMAREQVRLKRSSISDFNKRLAKMVQSRPEARIDYVTFFDPVTLEPLKKVTEGAHMALAIYIGKTRLIDNGRL
jgi:pantoate--beta-alanine ligase